MVDEPGQVAVEPDSLDGHADHLDRFAASIDRATRAAQHVRMDTGAYGQVCAFVPVALNTLSIPLADGLRSIVDSIHDTATRLRQASGEYTSADARSRDRVQGSGQ